MSDITRHRVLGDASSDARPQRAVVTVLKADLSGSTALAERLDPEELRGVLGSYFAALVREIHHAGGSVDKFVGDGVIAVFGADDRHADDAARAVIAGIAMQEAIVRENDALRRRHGVELACRVGVATGTAVIGAVAEEVQSSEIVIGEVVALAEALESAAPLGGVLVSPATRAAAADVEFAALEHVKPKGATGTIPAHRVLGIRDRARHLTVARRTADGSASLQVTHEREYVLAEERKNVTVLFADISSSAPLSSRLEPGELRLVLGAYFGVLARAIQRYGGTMDKYVGDAVMAVFGAPVSHEDDGIRAVRAGLEIQRASRALNEKVTRDHGIEMSIRVGVNTGEVVAGLLPGELAAYTVTGDTVNTAQRIEAAAPLGGVLISDATRALTHRAFFFEGPMSLTLKGKSEPVLAYLVRGAERRGNPRDGVRIVGRERELARLHALFRESLTGTGRVVHVHGEAGVGKTRLVGEMLATLPERTTRVRAHATSYEQQTPYALIADLVRQMLGITSSDAERDARAKILASPGPMASGDAATDILLEVLGYGARSALDPAGKRRLLLSILHDEVRARATAAPFVVVIEDLHWRDASSSDLLGELMRSVPATRCLFVTTSRDAADAVWAAERIALDALPPAAARELLDRLAPGLDESTTRLVLERTGGNPFFIEEVVRYRRPDRELTVPPTVQDLLEARLDSLAEGPRRVAHDAAVIGRTFWHRVLARVSEDRELDRSLAGLEVAAFIARVLASEPTYAFMHALVQEVAYRTQLIARRRTMHVVVGDAYQELYPSRVDEFVDTLAFHYRRGDDDAKATRWLLRAGRRAQRLYANAEALDYFGDAVDRARDDPGGRAEAHEAAGDVQRVIGRYDDAVASYGRALDVLGPSVVLDVARVQRKIGLVQQLRGNAEAALATYEQVLAAIPRDASGDRARALLSLADLQFRRGNAEIAIGHLTEALALGEIASDDEAVAEALKLLGTVYSYRGELALALEHQERSLAAYVRLGDPLGEANLHNNIGRTERRQSRHSDALESYARSLTIRERIGDQLGRVHSHVNMAEIHFFRDELDRGERHYRIGLEISDSIGYALGSGAALIGLGATNVARGRPEQGMVQLQQALADFERDGQRTLIVEGLRDLTDAYIALGSPLAVATAERGAALARELALPELIAIALQSLGAARLASDDVPGALVALEEARSLLVGGDDRQELGRTLALLARGYDRLPVDDPRRGTAPKMREEAHAILTALGATLDLRRLFS